MQASVTQKALTKFVAGSSVEARELRQAGISSANVIPEFVVYVKTSGNTVGPVVSAFLTYSVRIGEIEKDRCMWRD